MNILVESLKIKLYIIICTETWNIVNSQEFVLPGYKIYYNYSKINKSDGVVVHMNKNFNETTKIIEYGNDKMLNTQIWLNNNSTLDISAVYRSYDFSSLEFIFNMKKHLQNTRNSKNHLIIGDFNINIIEENEISQEFLNTYLEEDFSLDSEILLDYLMIGSKGNVLATFLLKTTQLKLKLLN